MKKCQYCKDFKDEEKDMEIAQLLVGSSYYDYECPLNYCPSCGKEIRDEK